MSLVDSRRARTGSAHEVGVGTEWLTPRLERWRRLTDGPLLVLAVGSMPFLLLEIRRDEIPRSDVLLIDIVNVIVLVAFAVDYIVELALARNRGRYIRSEWSSLAIVVSQGLALAPSLAGLGALRVIRAGRLWRVVVVGLRVVSLGRSASHEARAVVRQHAFRFAISLALFTWIAAGAAVVVAEGITPGGYRSYMDGLWWSASTITTVGYGDITPHTFAGRVIGIITMVVGISTFAIVTAKIAEFLVRSDRSDEAPTSVDDSAGS